MIINSYSNVVTCYNVCYVQHIFLSVNYNFARTTSLTDYHCMLLLIYPIELCRCRYASTSATYRGLFAVGLFT